jgi:hypothetical protein
MPVWPPYDSGRARYLELGETIRPTSDLHQDSFVLMQRLYTTRMASLGP